MRPQRPENAQKSEICPRPWQKTGVFRDFYSEIAIPFFDAFQVQPARRLAGINAMTGANDFMLHGAETSL
jgi:hypothetical protein